MIIKAGFPKPKGMLELVVWEVVKPVMILKRREKLGKNVVVNNAITQMSMLLGGTDMSDRYINRMQFGTGSTSPAAETDTALESAISPIKTITSTTYPTVSSVKFQAFLLEDEANGFPIKEAGLLFANTSPLLAARKTFAALTKSSDFVFEWNWTIYW